jgi:hypothetical protein
MPRWIQKYRMVFSYIPNFVIVYYHGHFYSYVKTYFENLLFIINYKYLRMCCINLYFKYNFIYNNETSEKRVFS